MIGSLKEQGIANQYVFDRPQVVAEPIILDTLATIKHVFDDNVHFKNSYSANGPHSRGLLLSLGKSK